MEGERLQRFLARAGIASRRKAEALIESGRVHVDGIQATLGARVLAGQRVSVDGREVVPAALHRTFMLNKPRGVISTASDERGRQHVLGILPKIPGLHPVGRLDRESEGLLLLTTDGALTLQLTHPRYEHPKRYRVWSSHGTLSREACARLCHGVTLDDGPARALAAEPLDGGATITLGEGRKRQLRRMCEVVGFPVTRLVRTHVSDLALGDLAPGAFRELTTTDLERLGYTPTKQGPEPS